MPPLVDTVLRPMIETDRLAVLALCRRSLGWKYGDPNEEFFRWKHLENSSGPSPAWVAESPDGEVVGLRVFMRWTFIDASGRRLHAVRAVDTATDPNWQGRGIFTKLTLAALPDLRVAGSDFVFNTPNDKSRPGYLKMGWGVVGRAPVAVRPGSLAGLRRMLKSNAPAEMWSEPVTSGIAASEFFRNESVVGRLLEALPVPDRITTDRSAAFLRWRYDFAPLNYRVMAMHRDPADGVVVFRVRRRGEGTEATIVDVLSPERRGVGSTLARIQRATGADYLISAGPRSTLRARLGSIASGQLPAPRVGPVVTWKSLNRPGIPTIGDVSLTMGDIELF